MNIEKQLETLEGRIRPKSVTYTIQTSDGLVTLTKSRNVAEDIRLASEALERKSATA